MMIYYYLSFLIGEVWLDLRNNILFRDLFYFLYLWETSHNRSLG